MNKNEELARKLERLREQGRPQPQPQREPARPEKSRRFEQGWQLPVQPGDFAPEDEWERIRQRVARDAQLADERARRQPPQPAVPSWAIVLIITVGLTIILSALYPGFLR